MRYAGEKKFNIWVAMALGILGLFLIFVVYPLILILYKSVLSEDGSFSLAYFGKFFARKYYWSTLVNSFKVTIVSTLLAAVLGLVMAYVLRSVRIRGSKYLNILIVMSYLSPPFIGAYAWIQLLGRNGFITKILNDLFHVKLNGIYGFAGIVLVFSLQSFPLVYMYISGALKNLDNSLNEAAESLGCSAMQRVVQVIVPLVMPTMLASSLLVFMRVFSDFGTPMLIGEGYKTFPVLMYSQFMGEVSTDDHFAAALCVIIIGITLLLFFFQRYLGNRYTYSMTALKPMEAEHCTGLKNVLSHLFVYLVVLIAILPQLTVIFTSFLATGGGSVYTGGFSLDNYRNTLFSKNNNGAIFNTYLFGLCAIAIVVVLGILISYLTVRKKSILTNILDTVTMFPYIIPGSVLGISFLYAFNTKPFLLSGTALIIVISLSIRRMPYTIRSSTAIIGQISPSVEEAAISLGCSETKSFAKITVPMMMSGVLSGAIMSWITLISELSSSIILYTSKTQTLTVAIYAEVIRSNFGNAAAYSTILTLTSILSLLLFFKLTGSNDISI
ncbi:iron(III) transport system permease protein [Lacrimispora sphenoides]|jgi:iron(III) transport system permease protein|uniref:Iron(III) transport system permease protein n=1 Tax=Lacrimispora sphenoides JCM 1415 TaxID=1297793 RepID=A0ABY1CFU2_9FIRM|nr:iron ABC transporter permease [Lacrimispora sphenoides]EXG84218.1 ABC-type Fe3+ transport system, permease component [Clostridium sp. ASBs410]SET77769.1 iron(III) transport system permease protein [Lacrimispora sphenoides]SEU01648.1 iron(III) transport system permease protein [[Clostridium] sphenoides JCM 1415]SUY53279.1 binding-protein-dependent transport system inner membrane protein [Lacrimispora sphenoides]